MEQIKDRLNQQRRAPRRHQLFGIVGDDVAVLEPASETLLEVLQMFLVCQTKFLDTLVTRAQNQSWQWTLDRWAVLRCMYELLEALFASKQSLVAWGHLQD
jgi:hypothetical protein